MALMFTYNLPQKKTRVFITGRQSFFPFAIARQICKKKAEQAIVDSMLFRQEALLHQCKARRIAQSTFGVWDGFAFRRKSNQPSHGYPETYLGTSPADGFTSVMARVVFCLAQNSDCPETKTQYGKQPISIWISKE
jgi:hypothetical protein